jgi:hypothetical protein
VPLPCDVFKPLIDGGIEILFSALRTDPRWDAFNIDGVPFEMKPGAYPPKFQCPFTKFARLTFPHPTHLLRFRDIGCNNQEDARGQKPTHNDCLASIRRLAHNFIPCTPRVTGIPASDVSREDDLFDVDRLQVILGHLFVRMGANPIALLANGLTHARERAHLTNA